MSFLIIFLILFFLLVIYLLWTPIVLLIDTRTNQYFIQLKGFVKASILSDKEEIVRIKMKVLFLTFKFYPLRRKKNATESKKIKKHNTKNSSKRIQFRKFI